jgi:uncharacterized protein
MTKRPVPLLAKALLLAVLVSGCAGSPPTNYYTLASVPPAAVERTAQALSAPSTLAVGPVVLPDYIDRPQIVTRASPYTMKLAANDQWAAPLYDTLPRVLVEDLALRLPADRIVAFPSPGVASFDSRVVLDITRFDVDAAGMATLAARWQLIDRTAQRAIVASEDVLQRQADGGSYEAHAAALSGTLADLADRIAAAVAGTRRPAS